MTDLTQYLKAIKWIAYNDEDSNLTDLESLQQQISVVLVADVFNVAVETVAQEIMTLRFKDFENDQPSKF